MTTAVFVAAGDRLTARVLLRPAGRSTGSRPDARAFMRQPFSRLAIRRFEIPRPAISSAFRVSAMPGEFERGRPMISAGRIEARIAYNRWSTLAYWLEFYASGNDNMVRYATAFLATIALHAVLLAEALACRFRELHGARQHNSL